MAVIKFYKMGELTRRVLTLDSLKYVCYYTLKKVMLRPDVTTKGRDSFVCEGTKEEVDSFVEWFGKGRSFPVEELTFEEEKFGR